MLVVAVKPQDVASVLGEVADALPEPRPVVVSLAAGIPTGALERWLPASTPVVRVMPNTPMLVGRAMCVLSPGTHGHGGAYGTQAWIDPQKGLVFVLMVQRADFRNSDDSPVRKAFQQAAVDAVGH